MRPYLNNYIQTLSKRRQERVGSLLEEARVGKEQLSTLRQRLERTVADGATLILQKQRPEVLIRSQPMRSNLLSVEERIEELFRMSNTIALMLSSHAAILASDVKAIEDELLVMDKMISNFAFLLADNQAYDYAFFEGFVDELNRDMDLGLIPDRSSLPFGPADQAFVRTDEGTLGLPESTLNSHGMTAEIVASNAGAFTIVDTGLSNILKRGNSTGWKRTMLTAGPVNAPLPEGRGRPGAQAVLEFRLTQPSPCSEIRLSPYANLPIELLQVTTFDSEEDTQGTNHIEEVRRLDRPFTFHFPMRPVFKLRVVINQPIYNRATKREDVMEHRYRHMLDILTQRRESPNHTYKRIYFVNAIEQSILLETMGKSQQSVSLPANNLDPDRGPMSIANLVFAAKFDRPSLWTQQIEEDSRIVLSMLRQTDSDVNEIRRHGGNFEVTQNAKMLATDNPISQVLNENLNTQITESGYTYYYNIGLHHVSVGVESPGFKGVHVSKPLPAPGDIGAVRIKTSEDNYEAPISARHSKLLTSVEYSVSNLSSPEHEVNWKPILPVGTVEVKGERLFLNKVGNAFFRFEADSALNIAIYRNGYLMGTGGGVLQWIGGSRPGTLAGLRVGLSVISPDDIFTCDYVPVDDPTTVSFEGDDYRLPSLVSAHDEGGAGERFFSTEDRNTITLASHPYIDPELASAGSYQPIVVQMNDGGVAQNLTDYQTRRSVSLPSDGYYYIHSGNTIMFNRPILTPFRVYYQYLQNNVRIRTVLRCNVKDFVSPKVDYVHLKAKTRSADARAI